VRGAGWVQPRRHVRRQQRLLLASLGGLGIHQGPGCPLASGRRWLGWNRSAGVRMPSA
jgi:hypothetical protein